MPDALEAPGELEELEEVEDLEELKELDASGKPRGARGVREVSVGVGVSASACRTECRRPAATCASAGVRPPADAAILPPRAGGELASRAARSLSDSAYLDSGTTRAFWSRMLSSVARTISSPSDLARG